MPDDIAPEDVIPFAIAEALSRRAARFAGAQLIEQRLGLPQVERVEAFSQPVIDRSNAIA